MPFPSRVLISYPPPQVRRYPCIMSQLPSIEVGLHQHRHQDRQGVFKKVWDDRDHFLIHAIDADDDAAMPMSYVTGLRD